MTCRQVERQLASYSAGMLTEQRECTIAAHLAGCESCRRQLAQYTTLDAAITNDHRAPDARRVAALLLQLEQERLWRHWSRGFLCQSLLHFTAFATLILAAYGVLHSSALSRLQGLAHHAHLDWVALNHPLILFLGLACLLPLAWGIVVGMNALLERA
jgi:hypothetical protein